jgi:hypothetical protein
MQRILVILFQARLVELINLYSRLPRCHLKQYYSLYYIIFFPIAKVTRDVIHNALNRFG